jgi:hypothetical protein
MKKLWLLFALFAAVKVNAQPKYKIQNLPSINPKEWNIPKNDTLDYEFGSYLGKKALLIKRKIDNYKSASLAYPKNLTFKNGIIELDLAFAGKGNGYIGLAFRIKDSHHYETVYFRPLSSGTINAIQYMPEKKPEFNWWDYEADKYQANAILPSHGWFHVKVIVIGRKMEVYVNNAPKPAMVYTELDSSLTSGSVGYWHGNTSLGAYRNVTIKTLE